MHLPTARAGALWHLQGLTRVSHSAARLSFSPMPNFKRQQPGWVLGRFLGGGIVAEIQPKCGWGDFYTTNVIGNSKWS